jgi:hypothetical protein
MRTLTMGLHALVCMVAILASTALMAATAIVPTDHTPVGHTPTTGLARIIMTPTTIHTTTRLLPIMGQASASHLGSKL